MVAHGAGFGVPEARFDATRRRQGEKETRRDKKKRRLLITLTRSGHTFQMLYLFCLGLVDYRKPRVPRPIGLELAYVGVEVVRLAGVGDILGTLAAQDLFAAATDTE